MIGKAFMELTVLNMIHLAFAATGGYVKLNFDCEVQKDYAVVNMLVSAIAWKLMFYFKMTRRM